ncbi:MAG: phage holin family protein [Candidatus Pacebacteria bacterium]|nr:phage holin family protein [Candidatus Paceibacterota bacterium]
MNNLTQSAIIQSVEMLRFIIRIIGNAVALYVASRVVSGFIVSGNWEQYLIAGAVLGLLNMIVRPALKLVSFPIILLTLGLFTFIINILMLWLLDYLVAFVSIESLMALVWSTIIIGLVNLFFETLAKAA